MEQLEKSSTEMLGFFYTQKLRFRISVSLEILTNQQ
jgi:hypothetical protein